MLSLRDLHQRMIGVVFALKTVDDVGFIQRTGVGIIMVRLLGRVVQSWDDPSDSTIDDLIALYDLMTVQKPSDLELAKVLDLEPDLIQSLESDLQYFRVRQNDIEGHLVRAVCKKLGVPEWLDE